MTPSANYKGGGWRHRAGGPCSALHSPCGPGDAARHFLFENGNAGSPDLAALSPPRAAEGIEPAPAAWHRPCSPQSELVYVFCERGSNHSSKPRTVPRAVGAQANAELGVSGFPPGTQEHPPVASRAQR